MLRWSKRQRKRKATLQAPRGGGTIKSFWSSNPQTGLTSCREVRMQPLLLSAAPPCLASPLTSPAANSAFMFFSKSQVVLPRATLTEPGAKAALWQRSHTLREAGRRHDYCNACAHLFRRWCSLFFHPPTLRHRTHAHTSFDCLNSVAVIKTH